MTMRAERALLEAFEGGAINPEAFSHRDHLKVAWAMLGVEQRPFHQAYSAYREGLVRLTAAAGAPEKFSETQTLGWLALVHGAVATTRETSDWDRFEAKAGLHGRSLIHRYSEGRLDDPVTRTGLILP
jgi:hypothetical protein